MLPASDTASRRAATRWACSRCRRRNCACVSPEAAWRGLRCDPSAAAAPGDEEDASGSWRTRRRLRRPRGMQRAGGCGPKLAGSTTHLQIHGQSAAVLVARGPLTGASTGTLALRTVEPCRSLSGRRVLGLGARVCGGALCGVPLSMLCGALTMLCHAGSIICILHNLGALQTHRARSSTSTRVLVPKSGQSY